VEEKSDKTPSGQVIRQDPEAGTTVPPGTVVVVYIAE
jgi:beta-lactam-binding protein with PASTA domain